MPRAASRLRASALAHISLSAGMMELADVTDSKSVGSNTVWVRVPLPAPRRSKVRFAPTSFLLLADASAAKKPPSHRSLAPPFPQKAPLGSPVRLQARSQRLAVATNLLRLPRLAARGMGRGVHAAPKKRAAGRDNMACARLKNRRAGTSPVSPAPAFPFVLFPPRSPHLLDRHKFRFEYQ